MSRFLVTGGTGFLGLAIAKALAARGDAVVAMDLGLPPQPVAGVDFRALDMLDRDAVEALLADVRPDAVIHCAAIVGVAISLADPAKIIRVNVEGSDNLFRAMGRTGVKRMVHISSEETYGPFRTDRIDEDHPQFPIYAYGISKLAVEHLGRTYALTHGLECVNIRTSWVYGPDFPRDRVPCNMVKAAARGAALFIPDGADSFIDHTYIDDAVTGILGALDYPNHPHDAYHIASDSAPSLAEIATILNALAPGARIEVGPGMHHFNGTVPVCRKGALDCRRAERAFGYRPRFDIRAGLSAYLDHVRATGQ